MDKENQVYRTMLAFIATLLICQAAHAAELFGTVDALSGSASLIDTSGTSTAISVGTKIYERQTIRSGQDGEVHLVTEDGGIIAVRPSTEFRVDEYKAEGGPADKMFMSLFRGAIRSITGWVGKSNTAAYRITTPTATIGVRGTDHETTVIDTGNGDEPGTYDNVNEGATVIKTPRGSAEVTPGKFAFAPKGKAASPVFLAQRPHFLTSRRLKIEERIQQRKESLHPRLDQMRQDRIKRLKTIQGNRESPAGQQHANAMMREPGSALERRTDIREHRLERVARYQQSRRVGFARRSEDAQGNNETRFERRKEAAENNIKRGNENRRYAEGRRRRMRE